MTQEPKRQEVKNHCDPQDPYHVVFSQLIVHDHVLVIYLLVVGHDVINDEAVRDVVNQCHTESGNDQPEELFVVFGPHTVVDPPAVVVKFVHAPVASAAVLRRLKDVSIANFAHKLVAISVEPLVPSFAQTLRSNSRIGGVGLRRDKPIHDHYARQHSISQSPADQRRHRVRQRDHIDQIESEEVDQVNKDGAQLQRVRWTLEAVLSDALLADDHHIV